MTEETTKRATATAAPVVAPSAQPDDGKRTPEEWAGVCGQRRAKTFEETVTMVNGRPFDFVGPFLWQHEAASVEHGWKLHEHHEGAPIRLTREDYEAALKAVTPEKGNPVPHHGALSPHKPKPEAPAPKGA